MFEVKHASLVAKTVVELPDSRRAECAVTVDQDGMIQLSFTDPGLAQMLIILALQNQLMGFNVSYYKKD